LDEFARRMGHGEIILPHTVAMQTRRISFVVSAVREAYDGRGHEVQIGSASSGVS
jgi:hypothetical protein